MFLCVLIARATFRSLLGGFYSEMANDFFELFLKFKLNLPGFPFFVLFFMFVSLNASVPLFSFIVKFVVSQN